MLAARVVTPCSSGQPSSSGCPGPPLGMLSWQAMGPMGQLSAGPLAPSALQVAPALTVGCQASLQVLLLQWPLSMLLPWWGAAPRPRCSRCPLLPPPRSFFATPLRPLCAGALCCSAGGYVDVSMATQRVGCRVPRSSGSSPNPSSNIFSFRRVVARDDTVVVPPQRLNTCTARRDSQQHQH